MGSLFKFINIMEINQAQSLKENWVYGKQNSVKLSKKEIELINSVLVGSLLGDGHLQFSPRISFIDLSKLPRDGKTRFRFGQKIGQKAYVNFIYSMLKPLCITTQKPHQDLNSFFHFYTNYFTELTVYHEIWYQYRFSENNLTEKSYVKCVPKQLEKILTDPLSLFLWYLDDGSLRTDCLAARIATQCFSFSEHEFLQEVLKRNFQLETTIAKSGISKYGTIQRYSLGIPAKSFRKFLNLVQPFRASVPQMAYKFERPRND